MMRSSSRALRMAWALVLAGALGAGLSWAYATPAAVTDTVVAYVADHYVEPTRLKPPELLEAALRGLEKAVPEVLVSWKKDQGVLELRVGSVVRTITVPRLETVEELAPVLRRVYAVVKAHASTEELEWPSVEYATLNGLLQSLDPHSVLLSPEVNKEFRLSAHGSFGGLGIVIGIRDGDLTIIAPIEGTPAFRAGLKSKDKIVQIEDESTINMDLIEAVSKLRGEPGTSVTISIMREGWAEPKAITIVREIIDIHAVEAFSLEGGVGYVTIRNFQENTLQDLREALKKFRKEGVTRGLILDLRNNPGGLFDQAVAVADQFIDEGTIVTTVGAGSSFRRSSYARGWRTERSLPVVVLINHGSASASEIVAGALKYRRRALLIGTRTFGKGSVQQIFDLADGSALKLSIAQYLLPGDRSIQSVGVTPDLLLSPVEVPAKEEDREVRFELLAETAGEKQLERSFLEWATKPEEPIYRLAYLRVREDEEPRTSMELTRQEKRQKLDEDFAVQLARRILLEARGSTRRDLLDAAARVLPEMARAQEKRIVAALGRLGIDWSDSSGQPTKAASWRGSVELSFSPAKARAGQKVTMTLTVTNEGSEPLHRVRALTEADLALFNRRELVLGRIEPGRSGSWSLELTLPKSLEARRERVVAKVRDSRGPLAEARGYVAIEPLARPRFALSFELLDDGRLGSRGNGDRLPQKGETVVVSLKVENLGPGASEKAVAVFKPERGLEGVFVEVGRQEIGHLKPGAKESVALRFRLKSDFQEGSLPVELTVLDTVFREGLTAQVDLAKPSRKSFFQAPLISLAPGSSPLAVDGKTLRLEAQVTDDRRVESVLVFANDRKLFYRSGAQDARRLAVSAEVGLKEGLNQILIVARDDQKLVARRRLLVLREPHPAMALGPRKEATDAR